MPFAVLFGQRFLKSPKVDQILDVTCTFQSAVLVSLHRMQHQQISSILWQFHENCGLLYEEFQPVPAFLLPVSILGPLRLQRKHDTFNYLVTALSVFGQFSTLS